MGNAKQKMIRVANREDDIKDLGEWDVPRDDDTIETFHFVMGAACDAGAVAQAKAENKKGPRVHFVEIPQGLYDHMLESNGTLKYWIAQEKVTAAAA